MSLLTISKPLRASPSGSSKRIAIFTASIQRDYSAWSTSSSTRDIALHLKRGSDILNRRPLSHRKGTPVVRQKLPSLSQTFAAAAGVESSRYSSSMAPKTRPRPEPRPSACIILLSPTNQVLLLHRVQTSSAFPSAHVFPGGNLSAFHDLDAEHPLPEDIARHEDSLAYRLTAIRETFEESGILLARDTRRRDGALLNLPTSERDKARKAIYENKVPFVEWVKDVGGAVDTENLLPFTRWITPEMIPKRFSTQMYIYMLPLSSSSSSSSSFSTGPEGKEEDPTISEAARSEAMIPTPDGGVEHTAARFDEAATWLEKHRRSEVVLFPPQYFLLHLISQFLTGPPLPNSADTTMTEDHYRTQREQLLKFLETVPTTTDPKAAKHLTAHIPWSRKVISPRTLGIRYSDKRSILGLDKPGYELRDTDRGGDIERVVLVKFEKGGLVQNVEVRNRTEVLAEEREAAREANGAEGAKEGKGSDGSKL